MLLAVATFGVLITGPVIIGFIPVIVVGALIFFLGIELLKEALVETWGKVQRIEYLTVRANHSILKSLYTDAKNLDYCHCGNNGSLGLCYWYHSRNSVGLR